jgi:hypothetical protein
MQEERDELETAAIEEELASLGAALESRHMTAEEASAPAEADEPAEELDQMLVAERVADLGGAAAKAGLADILEGAEMLAASEDIAVESAIAGLIGDEDLAEAMDIAAISGQLFAVSELLEAIDMPVLASFLEAKGEELHDIAVDNIFRYSTARALSDSMAETGAELDEMAEQEMAEGAAQVVSASSPSAASVADLAADLEELLAEEEEERSQG